MGKAKTVKRAMALALAFLLCFSTAVWADAGSGTCSSSGSETCSGLGGSTCTTVSGCSSGTSGACSVASGTYNGHTYGWYCIYSCGGGEWCSFCSDKYSYSSCVNTACYLGVQGCTWNGNPCEGTPVCSSITTGSICASAGCTWTPTISCNLGANAACSPTGTPPNCCAGANECLDDGTGTGTNRCLSCVPSGSTSNCDPYGPAAERCCAGAVCGSTTWLCTACYPNGDSCGDNADCCSGHCVANTCAACLPLGEGGCSGNSDCCSGSRCELRPTPDQNSCVACSNEGSYCSQDSDCCTGSGLTCNLGTNTCIAPPCKKAGETCAANCCQPPKVSKPLYCDSLNQNPATCRYCAAQGENCGPSLKCCSPMGCNASGKCESSSAVAVCGAGQFDDVLLLSGIAALATAVLIALVYMAGEVIQNAKMISWSKTEAAQVVVSLVAASMVLYSISTFCGMNIGEAGSISSTLPYIYQARQSLNVYEGAQLYLENLMGAGTRNMAALRFNLGAYEVRTSFTKYECDAICWLSLASTNVAKDAGETMQLAITNNLLGTATVSYLTAAFEYFTLQYILNGLFLSFLPLAIVLRSIPFMRHLGGALIGIIVALYLLYPLMLVGNAVMAPYLAQGSGAVMYDRDRTNCAGINVFKDSAGNQQLICTATSNGNGQNYEWELGGHGVSEGELPNPVDLPALLKTNVLIFVTSVFLPAINFIVIAALARDLSRLLGEEADISRLGQMV